MLQATFPEYAKLMRDYGYGSAELVPEKDGVPGHIMLRKTFAEQCGAVTVEVTTTCYESMLMCSARIARSAVGNRGWNGGSSSATPKDAKRAAAFARDYMGQARQLLS